MTDQKSRSRNEVVNRVATRAWKDEVFRSLLFSEPRTALLNEFGEIPEGFENVIFKARAVDRVLVRATSDGRRLVVRPKRGDEPLSVVTRRVLGVPELVVVFYTKRCRYQCSFCTLPIASAYTEVSFASVRSQLSRALDFAEHDLNKIRQVSLGNEGSILDEKTFPRDQLEYVLKNFAALAAVEEIILETRSEFVSEPLLNDILEWISPCGLTLKIGLESANANVRERILRKKMDIGKFEAVVEMLGRRGVGLAAYVLIKADPGHSDEDGKSDAIETCGYLKELCRKSGTRLVLRINTMYRATNSMWAKWAEEQSWVPPSIFDLAEVMLDVLDHDVGVFAGLSEEGLATSDGHYEVRPDFQQWALDALELYNQTGDTDLLKEVAAYRSGGHARTDGERAAGTTGTPE